MTAAERWYSFSAPGHRSRRLRGCRSRASAPSKPITAEAPAAPIPTEHLDDLHQLGNIGYVRGIEAKLDEIVEANPAHGAIIADLRALVRNFELKRYMATVETLRDRDAP